MSSDDMVFTRSQLRLVQSSSNLPTLVNNEPNRDQSEIMSHSVATRSSRSSATVVAAKKAAQAQHARRLAEIEKKAAKLEFQAEIAAIEAESSCKSSRSVRSSNQSVKRWLHESAASHVVPSAHGNNNVKIETDNYFRSEDVLRDAVVASNIPSAPNPTLLSPHDLSGGKGVAAGDIHTRNDSIGITQLVQALEVLNRNNCSSNKNNFVKLPFFDGNSPLDWLVFKRAFQDTVGMFTESENLARLSVALKGIAREAVAMLLVLAPHAGDVIEALDRRFGRPEQIVIQELNHVRALPKLGQEVRELHIFATRVRNCVEVAKLLQHSDHLRSPELFSVLYSKLSPLLRSRWLDFAASLMYGSSDYKNQTKVEILSRFLNREVDLITQFGAVTDLASTQNHRAHTVLESNVGAVPKVVKSPVKLPENKIFICILCDENHKLKNCQKFSSMTIDDRWQFVKSNKVCHRCLQKVPHNFKYCKNNKENCTVPNCSLKHHALLHNNFPRIIQSDTQSEPTINSNNVEQVLTTTNNSCLNTRRPLLKVIAVTVSGPAASVDTYALLDDGSTATFIDADIASQIGVKGPEGHVVLDCVGGMSKDSSIQYVDFKIKGQSRLQEFNIKDARAIENLGLLSQSVCKDHLNEYEYLSDLVDYLCYEDAKPTILLGIDNWHLSAATSVRKGKKSQPVAIETPLGWVVFGFSSSRTRLVETTYHLSLRQTESELEMLIKEQYKLDSIGITKHQGGSIGDQRALKILDQSTERLVNGHFQVGLLWKADNLVVPNSYPLALSRFKSLELKMLRDTDYAKLYKLNIKDTLSKGYAEECRNQFSSVVQWYLPHFGVINPNKPGKLRVVHDAAAKVHGVSLNSMLLPGPDLLQPLLGILMRFREGNIALVADIKEMFPQIKIRESDRDAQRFLWRDNPTEPIKIYRMSSMIFGACSSPSTAIYIINRNASEFRNEFPKAVHAITIDTYMDDYIGSLTGSIEDAAHLASDIVEVHKRGGFEMRGWISNEVAALKRIPEELLSDISSVERSVDLGNFQSTAYTRTLGLIWQPHDDVISFNLGLKKDVLESFTKRDLLAQVMRIYDPLGILAPIVVRGRILFQNLWRKNLGWDEQLPESDRIPWCEWFECLKTILNLRIPRCYNSNVYAKVELHVFCDASELAYAAVAYWRFIMPDGRVKLALIASKARVSPLKPVSIPRLELQGALLAARLASTICEVHRVKPTRRIFWCDSMTVLGWLRSDARNFKPFVAHRVGEILESTILSEWRWVQSDNNVADLATRGNHVMEPQWVSGPNFLLTPSSEWPVESKVATSHTIGQEELKPLHRHPASSNHLAYAVDTINFVSSNQLYLPVVADVIHFSSWIRLVRATARTHKFIAFMFKKINYNLKNFWLRDICLNTSFNSYSASSIAPATHTSAPALEAEDITRAERNILSQSQLNAFGEEIDCCIRGHAIHKKSRLQTLSPELHEGLLVMAGRTSTVFKKKLIILDGKQPETRLLISHYHAKFAHANTETVINELRQEYWILGLRNSVRSIVLKCQFCKLLKRPTLHPPMADLPEARLSHHRRAFTFTGLDYFGPIVIAVGRRTEKRWVALFTCLVTRAVHLETVASLSADAAVMCLKRFIARRGTPDVLYSDNGTSFVGANRELKALYDAAIPNFAAEQRIKWRFIPPSAPFMGGAWERLVRSVKTALKVTLRERTPSEPILNTLLAEAEAIVNSRPLTHISPDADYPEALTPNHFLLGDSSGHTSGRTEELTDAVLSGRSGWKKALRLADHFWRRWLSEYLPTLAPRRVPGTNIKVEVGDPVLIGDGNLPRGSWPRGIVQTLYPGRDGVVRVVDVKTAGGILKRPLKKIVLL